MRRLSILCLMLAALLPAVTVAAERESLRRFAFVVGSNQGGSARADLRYAVSDARAFSETLLKIGGLAEADRILLADPDRNAFLAGVERLRAALLEARAAAQKLEVIVYYSGHSDEESLLFNNEPVSYPEVRRLMERLPADVRIVVLDSCASGAFTRVKGGKSRPPFLLDEANDMKGYAIMTSSSSDEASQESDRLRGSFFTHALMAGLHGAADMGGDGRITLSEAYQYAYNETLARTEKTLSGPQHPNYNIQMTGTGDVVMTDLRAASSLLQFDSGLAGRFFIRDAGGGLVLEFRKSAGRILSLGLEAGAYALTREQEGRLYTAQVVLRPEGPAALAESDFSPAPREWTTARGDADFAPEDFEPEPVASPVIPAEGVRRLAWDGQLYPDPAGIHNTAHERLFYLLAGQSDYLDGFALGLGPGIAWRDTRGTQVSLLGNYSGGNFEGVQVGGFYNSLAQSARMVQAAAFLNLAHGPASGTQVAAGMNYAGRSLDGVQVAGFYNYAGRRMTGVQFAGMFNDVCGRFAGLQFGGVYSYGCTAVSGVQFGGAFNYAGTDFDGVQFAGAFNFTGGAAEGVQVTSALNYAGNASRAVQVGGGVNIAGDGSRCTQIGMLNLAGDGAGLQIGAINLAGDHDGPSVGIIPWSKRTRIGLVAWNDSLIPINLGVKFTTHRFYSILAAGRRDLRAQSREGLYALQYHAGWRVPVQAWLDLNLDAGVVGYRESDALEEQPWFDSQAAQFRLIADVRPWPFFSCFGGAGVNLLYRAPGFTPVHVNDVRTTPLYLGGVEINF